MSDDRPADDPVQAIAKLRAELDDLRSTALMRAMRRATGDIEPTIRSIPKADTLLMQGQAVNRADFPLLWQWVQDQSLIISGFFTVGNGSTTFNLPDFRGRVPVGVGTLGGDTYALGALVGTATRTLSTANMPAHDHNVSVSGSTNAVGDHQHARNGANRFTNTVGDHPGHNSGSAGVSAGSGLLIPGNSQNDRGGHNHTVDPGEPDGGHSHSVSLSASESTVGSGTAFDVRQPSIAINWAIWV